VKHMCNGENESWSPVWGSWYQWEWGGCGEWM
jgi:hypothetical protein